NYPSPVPGTLLYQLKTGSTAVFATSGTITFNPGMNANFLPITVVQGSIQSGTTLTFAATATVGGLPASTNTTSFLITAPGSAPLNFGQISADGNIPFHKLSLDNAKGWNAQRDPTGAIGKISQRL